MDTLEIAVTAVQQHNAQTSREAEVVKETDRLLRLNLFPYERVWVDVRFDLAMTEHSSSKINAMLVSGEVHGIAEIRYQSLFLWHDFKTFFDEVIAHELAHVIVDVRNAEKGLPSSKNHDEEWAEVVMEINPDCDALAKVRGEFDDRPIKIHKGGIGCECECGDEDAFVVFPNTPSSLMKLRNEDLTCPACKSAYVKVDREQWPREITEAVDFYRCLMESKIYHLPLSR
tara:strand:+ start:4428 stop:5114 length:687 start_codon:yes stop_codon:yes gene_type:complete